MSGTEQHGPGRAALNSTQRAAYLALGLLMLALGFIGIFVPVMPTTIFVIAAAWCFGRSSPRLEKWLLQHPQFGPPLRAWRESGAISRRAKVTACLGMILGYGFFLIGAHPGLPLAGLVALIMLGCALYVTTRPEPQGPARPAC